MLLVAESLFSPILNFPVLEFPGPFDTRFGQEMALFNPEVRRRTDALDAAGNTTAAIGKGFAIGSAALVSLAL